MCLAIPGRVMEWLDQSPLFASAKVDFGGVQRTVNMACVPEASVQDYVLVHAGIAISRIDPQQAERIWEDLAALGLAHVVDEDIPTDPMEGNAKELARLSSTENAVENVIEQPPSTKPDSSSKTSRSMDE